MKKAIKKTCVVLLLFALLASQVAASYSETGTLNEGTSAISAAERYLSNWAYNSYMYADKNLTLGTVLDAEVDPAKLTLATSEFMALRNDADGQENNISVAVSKMQANIQFMIDKATYFSTIRQYNGLQRTDFNTDYVVQRVDVQGNFAVIEVLENISFQYVGAEDSSFSQKEHTVSLIKVDGEWIVANVETKYDWFANEYKDIRVRSGGGGIGVAVQKAGSAPAVAVAAVKAVQQLACRHRGLVAVRRTVMEQSCCPVIGIVGGLDARSAAGRGQRGSREQRQQRHDNEKRRDEPGS